MMATSLPVNSQDGDFGRLLIEAGNLIEKIQNPIVKEYFNEQLKQTLLNRDQKNCLALIETLKANSLPTTEPKTIVKRLDSLEKEIEKLKQENQKLQKLQNQFLTLEQKINTLLPFRIYFGKTEPGDTNWKQHSEGLIVEVDTSATGFQNTPMYFCNLTGERNTSYAGDGGYSPYNQTNKKFTILTVTTRGISPSEANAWKWHIQWIAIGE